MATLAHGFVVNNSEAFLVALRTLSRATTSAPAPPTDAVALAALDAIQRRVLWLATRIIHEANHVRPNPDGTKVGGHQASSASSVSILTALYFSWLRRGDRVAVKPHASPTFHAIQYLLGELDRRFLTTLRQVGGLQAYPSRTKDPDNVDFSTGSVGLGVAATLFAALADRYAEAHFARTPREEPRRFVALVGDAELDEGNIWEALADPSVSGARLGNVLWVVDLNRQSLDRVVPGIRVRELQRMFAAAGWNVHEAKYGNRLEAAFAASGGSALRQRIDDMSNEEYQGLVRMSGDVARRRLVDGAPASYQSSLRQAVRDIPDEELPGLLGDLGGHDLATLLDRFNQASENPDSPSVLFAYTMKGWGLPIAGDPLNHSALLTQTQTDDLRERLGIDPTDEWAGFSPESLEGKMCLAAARRLYGGAAATLPSTNGPIEVPDSLGTRAPASTSSQEAFGNTLVELSRLGGPLAERMVTASPDVAVSTNLGGWINRVGVFAVDQEPDRPEDAPRLLRWQPGPSGHHVELGISEMNLFLLLGQFGLSQELNGEPLIPVGTVYDPFICRGLDALIYGVYSGSRFLFAGTPSGVTLSPEGGAHQSSITTSIGIELPSLEFFEPCFARETEWCVLEGLRRCVDRASGVSSYLRLSTKTVDQASFEAVAARLGEAELRRRVLAGGYRLIEPPDDLPGDAPRVVIATSGSIVPEAIQAALDLHAEGVAATVLNLTSARRLYEGWQAARLTATRTARAAAATGHLEELFPPEERRAPIVTVTDGASHSLAFLGGVFGQPLVPLGVDRFGQSGSRADLYAYTGIDAAHIANAALLSLTMGR